MITHWFFSLLLLLLVSVTIFPLQINHSRVTNAFEHVANQNTTTAIAGASSPGGPSNSIINTFHLRGGIGSLVTSILNPSNILHKDQQQYIFSSATDEYVVVGNWTMDVKDGAMEYFQADFVMTLKNGTQMHVHNIGNFRNVVIIPPTPNITEGAPTQTIPTKITLRQADNYSLSLFGSVDIFTNGKLQWQDVPITIDIFNGNTISIFLDSSYTDNHFKGVPIYGVVVWMSDENYVPLKPPAFAYH